MLDKWVLLNAWCFVMFSARVISESSWSLKKYYLVSRAFLRGRFLPGPLFRSWFLWCTGPKSLAPGESSLGGKGLGVKQKHTCSVAVYGHRLLISTTAHVNGHTLVPLLCTATETPNINYSSCERTHTRSAVVYGHRLLISTTAHVNGHTLVQLLCTATDS